MQKRKVYILLQELKSDFGFLFKLLKNVNYNHASIGISDSFDEFYSFRSKWGLCIEHPFFMNKEHKEDIQCMIYEIEVSEAVYNEVANQIKLFVEKKQDYHYSYLSFILGFIGITHSFKHGYYCSRFVAEILASSKVLYFKKDTSLYMPSDFIDHNMKKFFEGKAKDFKPERLSLAF